VIAFVIIITLVVLAKLDEAAGGPLARWADTVFAYLGEGRRTVRPASVRLAEHPAGKDVA